MPLHIRRKKTLKVPAKYKKQLIELLPTSAGDLKSKAKIWQFIKEIYPETTYGNWFYATGPNIEGAIEIKEGSVKYRFFPWVISWSK